MTGMTANNPEEVMAWLISATRELDEAATNRLEVTSDLAETIRKLILRCQEFEAAAAEFLDVAKVV